MNAVLFDEVARASGNIVGVATLNSERTLNALSLTMVRALHARLDQWADRSEVRAVLIKGAGERAFCAGGDIQDLYGAMEKNHAAGEVVDNTPERFFEAEYRLDFSIHRYPKPIIAFGRGIVMGGGLGIFAGSRLRLVTPTTRIAMPEVTIGLFPDAGGTWTLRNLPVAQALFVGATGCQMNAADALHIGLATHAVPDDCDVIGALVAAEGDVEIAFENIAVDLPPGNLAEIDMALKNAVPDIPEDAAAARSALERLAGTNPWVDRALATMRAGCPTSIGIVCEQLRRAPALDLTGCFALEMVVASRCAQFEDFAEGVRARLIARDGDPSWYYDGGIDHVLAHFEPPWDVNPLEKLGD